MIIAVAVCYFVVCGIVAFTAARRTATAADFFVAGRGVGLAAMTLAAMAATLSGFIFVGGPALFYTAGFGALFISLSASITTPLSAWALARPMRLLREVRGVVTVPDAVGARYNSPAAQGVCAVALVIAATLYIATNLVALGKILGAIFPLALPVAIIVGTIVVLAYTATGGILAGIYTDVFQGAVKAAASILVFVAVLRGGHGLAGLSHTILAHDAAFLGPWGTMTPLRALSLFFLFGLGTLGQPHVISKYYMLRDPRQLKWYPLLMTAVLLVTLLLFFGVGLGAKVAVLRGDIAPLVHADDATATFLLARTPQWLAAVVFSGIVAASMGIVNAFLNVAAAALVHDIPLALGRAPHNALRRGRITTVVVATAALLIALQPGAVIAVLGIFSWGLFASTLVPALAIGLNWPGATKVGAIASMMVGVVVTLSFESVNALTSIHFPAGVSGSGLALVLSILTFVAVSLITRDAAARDLPRDVARIMQG